MKVVEKELRIGEQILSLLKLNVLKAQQRIKIQGNKKWFQRHFNIRDWCYEGVANKWVK